MQEVMEKYRGQDGGGKQGHDTFPATAYPDLFLIYRCSLSDALPREVRIQDCLGQQIKDA